MLNAAAVCSCIMLTGLRARYRGAVLRSRYFSDTQPGSAGTLGEVQLFGQANAVLGDDVLDWVAILYFEESTTGS